MVWLKCCKSSFHLITPYSSLYPLPSSHHLPHWFWNIENKLTHSQWQGLGDVINHFRTATLGIEPLISRHGAGALERLKVPYTYCWSEGLIEKPDDWKDNIGMSNLVPPHTFDLSFTDA